jgi:hypothetical protein
MPLSRTVAPYSSAHRQPPAADPWAQAASTAFHTRYQPAGAHLREIRRRTKVIGRLPGERSCLRLVWAVLVRASRSWRGLIYTLAAAWLLQDLRRDRFTPPTPEAITKPVTTAA